EETTISLATRGNAYWMLTRNDKGQVVNIQVLDPAACQPGRDERGRLVLGVGDKYLPQDKFRHLKLMRQPGQLEGLGPIQAARTALQGAKDLQEYSHSWFRTGDIPSGILSTEAELSPSEAAEMKQAWHSREAHEVAILGRGLSYQPTLLSP